MKEAGKESVTDRVQSQLSGSCLLGSFHQSGWCLLGIFHQSGSRLLGSYHQSGRRLQGSATSRVIACQAVATSEVELRYECKGRGGVFALSAFCDQRAQCEGERVESRKVRSPP